MTIKETLQAFVHNGGPEDVKHFFNAHFPGLYSIVLAKNADCLTRVYIAPSEVQIQWSMEFE